MVTIEDFSRLVSGIYAAAVTAQHWESAIRDIHRRMGGIGASLLTSDGAVFSNYETTIPEEAAISYAQHYHRIDHVAATFEKGPVGRIWTGAELVAPYRNSEFYAGWLKPLDYGDGLFIRLCGGQGPSRLIVAATERTSRLDSP